MNELLNKLSAPFHPSMIEWKPQAAKGDKCMAIAYADPRAYMNRLDEVCGMNWGVTFSPWGDKLVCHLTIDGQTRSSTGEPDSQSENREIAGTAAEAQAFKRACVMFGLGRYLYDLPASWVEFDPQSKKITDAGMGKLTTVIKAHYDRTMRKPAGGAQTGMTGKIDTIQPTDTEKPAVPVLRSAEPSEEEELRIQVEEIMQSASINSAPAAKHWAIKEGYRTNIHSADAEWKKILVAHFGGMISGPDASSKAKQATQLFIAQCLREGKKLKVDGPKELVTA